MRRLYIIIIIGLSLFISLSVVGCTKDEPKKTQTGDHRTEHTGQFAGNDSDEGNENNESNEGDVSTGDDNGEKEDPEENEYDPGDDNIIENDGDIVAGRWESADGNLWLELALEGNFTGYGDSKFGFRVSGRDYVMGTYQYSDLKQHIWLDVQDDEGGLYSLDFRCIIQEERMTLWSENNKKWELKRVNG